jgi:hypothetical protein
MASPTSPVTMGPGSRCYRLTSRGQACVDVVETGDQTVGSLSRYLHDVLMMCGSGIWFDQLRQFMPPRSLEDSLRALLALGLIERMEPQEAPRKAAVEARSVGQLRALGRMAS